MLLKPNVPEEVLKLEPSIFTSRERDNSALLLYIRFLKSLKKQSQPFCVCPFHIHPRDWIPAPCLSSKPQKIKLNINKRLTFSSPDISTSSEVKMSSDDESYSSDVSSKNSDENCYADECESMKKDKRELQKALKLLRSGKRIPESTNRLVFKWKNIDHNKYETSNPRRRHHSEGERDAKRKQSKPSENTFDKEDLLQAHSNLSRKHKKEKKMRRRRRQFREAEMERKFVDLLKHCNCNKVEERNALGERERNQTFKCTSDNEDLINRLKEEVHIQSMKLKTCEEDNKILREDNLSLMDNIAYLKSERERNIKLVTEKRELALMSQLSDAKRHYTKVIDGYKETVDLLRKEINQHKTQDQEFLAIQQDESKNYKNVIIKLEKTIHRREREIENLRVQLNSHQNLKSSFSSELESEIVQRLEEFLHKNSSRLAKGTGNEIIFLDSIKSALADCFQNWKKQEIGDDDGWKEKYLEAQKEIDRYKKASVESSSETSSEIKELKMKLLFEQDKVKQYSSKCEELEARIRDRDGIDESLRSLKQLPQIMKDTEAKLLKSEQTANEVCIKNQELSDQLIRAESELEIKNDRLTHLERELLIVNDRNGQLQKEIEKNESKIESCMNQLERKDDILEKISSQLEERIRASDTLSSEMERLRDERNKDRSAYKSQCYEISRLEQQLKKQSSDKTEEEGIRKKEMASLEEKLQTLTLKNKAYETQMKSIFSAHKSVFSTSDP